MADQRYFWIVICVFLCSVHCTAAQFIYSRQERQAPQVESVEEEVCEEDEIPMSPSVGPTLDPLDQGRYTHTHPYIHTISHTYNNTNIQ